VNRALSRENTAVVPDSTANFPEAQERFSNWHVVPVQVRFGDESYRDHVELGPQEFKGSPHPPCAGDRRAAPEH
jgi:fatty acid-binding protein DegV